MWIFVFFSMFIHITLISGSLFTSVRWPPRRSAACDWRAVLRLLLTPDPRRDLVQPPLCWQRKPGPWLSVLQALEGSPAVILWLGAQTQGWWQRRKLFWWFWGGWGWWGWSGRGWPGRPESHLGLPSHWSLRQKQEENQCVEGFV